jgi:hypothetical protein
MQDLKTKAFLYAKNGIEGFYKSIIYKMILRVIQTPSNRVLIKA